MALQRLGDAVQPLQQVGRLEVQVRQGVGGGAQLGHHRRGLRPVTHDVADDEAGPVAVQRDDVVPVAADDVTRGRQAPPGDLQPGGHRRLGGQQAALQRVGDRPVPHQRQRVDDRRSGLGSQPGGGRDLAAAERGRARVARERQHPDDRVARGQRDRQERAAAGHDLASVRPEPLQRRAIGLGEDHRAAGVHAAGVRRARSEGDDLAGREGLARDPLAGPGERGPEPARHDLSPASLADRLAALEQVLQDEHAGPFGEAGDDGRERQPGDLGQVQAAAQQQARSFGGQLLRAQLLWAQLLRGRGRGAGQPDPAASHPVRSFCHLSTSAASCSASSRAS